MADIAAAQTSPARTRWLGWIGPELAVVAAGLAAALLFPDDLGFITRINILGIFTLSLALVIGQAGIGTLGQAAMFGAGSYSAALWALHVSAEPLSGLLIGALAGAGVAAASGLLLLRTRGLTLIMLSVAFAQVLLEIANKAASVTGGDDGLADIPVRAILGLFAFDFRGRVGSATPWSCSSSSISACVGWWPRPSVSPAAASRRTSCGCVPSARRCFDIWSWSTR